jgi:GntR family transcriptional regulator
VAPTIHPDRRQRRALVRGVAERAVVEARRNGLGVEELVAMIWEVAAEDPLPSVRELAGELVVNPRTVSQAYRELESEGVIYVRRGQGTFVAPTIHPDRRERRALVRGVAERAVVEARRNGLAVPELVTMIWEVAAESDGTPSPATATEGPDEVESVA